MDKKTGRHGFFAAAVLFCMYYSVGPVSASYSRVTSFGEDSSGVQKTCLAAEYGVAPAKVPVLPEMGPEKAGGLVNLTNADVNQQIAADNSQESESLHEESLPDNSAIFRKFLAMINEQVKRIRLLVLGES